MTGAIKREVEQLEQKMKEDAQTLKHEWAPSSPIPAPRLMCSIEMDMNNRKSETRSDLKGMEMSIEEINNKFTISLGDLRTEIETAKWEATRRGICELSLVFVASLTHSCHLARCHNGCWRRTLHCRW